MKSERQSIIRESWQRCREAGLTHSSEPIIEINTSNELNHVLDENHGLVSATQQKVLPFYDNLLSNSNCIVMLADTNGQLLNSWGDHWSKNKQSQRVFGHGVHWKESLLGTNAIGTALETGSIVQVFHDEHFLLSNRFMTGSAAPLFDAERRMTGVLSISSDAYIPTAHTLGMVKLMSQAIENQLIVSQFHTEHFLFWFNTSADNIDSQWSSLLVFDEKGMVISANRRAEVVLGGDLGLQSIEQLFDVKLSQLLSHPAYTPLTFSCRQQFKFHGIVIPPSIPKGRLLDFRKGTKPKASNEKQQVLDLQRLDMGDKRLSKAILQARKILDTDIPILIHGETGVGKEVFVNALHLASERRDAALIAVNCAAIPSELVESELFGYEKGAFTGAHNKGYVGLIRKADKGTLFLDELGDMPLKVQARLLRVLQERKVTPLGSTTSYPVDFKLVSATNRQLKEDVASGQFRQDLFYRVSGLNITLPSLRERTDKDVLIQYLLDKYASDNSQATISIEVLSMFRSHPWPGNIRQMVNVIQIALAMAEPDTITVQHLPDDFLSDFENSRASLTVAESQHTSRFSPSQGSGNNSNLLPNDSFDLHYPQMDEMNHPLDSGLPLPLERENQSNWHQVYLRENGNISATAKALNISRNTLYRRLREAGLK